MAPGTWERGGGGGGAGGSGCRWKHMFLPRASDHTPGRFVRVKSALDQQPHSPVPFWVGQSRPEAKLLWAGISKTVAKALG